VIRDRRAPLLAAERAVWLNHAAHTDFSRRARAGRSSVLRSTIVDPPPLEIGAGKADRCGVRARVAPNYAHPALRRPAAISSWIALVPWLESKVRPSDATFHAASAQPAAEGVRRVDGRQDHEQNTEHDHGLSPSSEVVPRSPAGRPSPESGVRTELLSSPLLVEVPGSHSAGRVDRAVAT
jgi:hypothetical protein